MAKKVVRWEDIGGGVHELLEDCNAADARILMEQSLGSIIEEIYCHNMSQAEWIEDIIRHRSELLKALCGTDPGEYKNGEGSIIFNGETRPLSDLSEIIDLIAKGESMVITKTVKGLYWVRDLV